MGSIVIVIRRAIGRVFADFLDLPVSYKLAFSCIFALLTGVSAQIRIPLPFSPVPVTGQVLVVLLAGGLLGRWGALSQAFYIAGAASGISWCSGGMALSVSPTLGYIAGFLPAAFLVGLARERCHLFERVSGKVLVMLAAVLIIHACGVLWLSALLHIPVIRGLELGSLPFVPFDVVKVYGAAYLAHFFLSGHKTSDSREN